MILWYFNHKAGGAYRPDCFTVRNTKKADKGIVPIGLNTGGRVGFSGTSYWAPSAGMIYTDEVLTSSTNCMVYYINGAYLSTSVALKDTRHTFSTVIGAGETFSWSVGYGNAPTKATFIFIPFRYVY